MSVTDTQYVVVEFEESAPVRAGFDRLHTLAESGSVTVLDAEFIRSIQGIASTVPASRVDAGLAEFDALDTRLLSQSDLDIVVDTITGRHMVAAVLVFSGPIDEALADWASAGAVVVRHGAVAPADLAAAQAGESGVSLLGT